MSYKSSQKKADEINRQNSSWNAMLRKTAVDGATQDLAFAIDDFIEDHPDDDIIIDLTWAPSSTVTAIKKQVLDLRKSSYDYGKTPQKIYFERFEIDGTFLKTSHSYGRNHASVQQKKRTVGGGVDGYSITESGGSYSVTPHYSSEETQYYYDAVTESSTEEISGEVRIKAVKLGTGGAVIKKEDELAQLTSLYDAAVAFKKKRGPKYKEYFPFNPSQPFLYDLSFMIGIFALLFWCLSVACCGLSLSISEAQAAFWFENLIFGLIKFDIVALFNSEILLWTCATISFIALLIMTVNRRVYQTEYGDSKDKKRLRFYRIIFLLLVNHTAFLYTAHLLPELSIIGIIPRIFSILLTYSGCSLSCILFFIPYFFIGLHYLLKSETAKETQEFIKEVKEFIKKGNIKIVENLMEEIHSYTTSDTDE